MIMILTSCSKGEEKMEIIAYGTPEFEKFIKNAPINLDKAWSLQLDYAKKNYDEWNYNWQKKFSTLFFIVDDYYIFTTGHVNNKMLRGYLLDGIWINTKTGEAFEKKLQKTIESKQMGWGKE